jgi:hypothetical protein
MLTKRRDDYLELAEGVLLRDVDAEMDEDRE